MTDRRCSTLLALALVTSCRGPGPNAASLASASPNAAPLASASVSVSPALAMSALDPKPSAVSPPEPAALQAARPIVSLPVPGFGDAVVSLPLGTSEPRLIALALHGNFDRPEWQCEVWREITRGQVFVLCPRGIPRRDVPKDYDRWEWGSLAQTKAEVVAALTALRAQYPRHVKPGPLIFTGFSLGAILGARLIQDPDLAIGAAVLTEGGYQGWTLAKARALQPTLGRLLFACGQTECRNAFRYQLDPLFKKAELPAAVVAEVKAGHTYDGPIALGIQAEWPAVVASLEARAERSH